MRYTHGIDRADHYILILDMRAIILAAGMGRRLAPMGWDKPKCLLPCGGITLLDNILTSLREHEVRDIVLVVGYQRELIQQEATKHELNCRWIVNDHFASTNTIHSLWLANDYLNDDLFLFNADVWFDRRILSLLLEREASALLVDEKQCGQEEVKITVDANLRITRIGKDLSPEQCMGEYVGIARLLPETATALSHALHFYNEREEHRLLFYESALDDILHQHIIVATPMGNLPAVEIDTPQDYELAKSLAETSTRR